MAAQTLDRPYRRSIEISLKNFSRHHDTMVRVTDFARPKRTYDKDDGPRKPRPAQISAYQIQRESTNPRSEARRHETEVDTEADKECSYVDKRDIYHKLSKECY